jgi:hypothetical protein
LAAITAFSALLIGAMSLLPLVPRAAKLKASELVLSPGRVVRDSPADAACVRASEADPSSDKLYYLV